MRAQIHIKVRRFHTKGANKGTKVPEIGSEYRFLFDVIHFWYQGFQVWGRFASLQVLKFTAAVGGVPTWAYYTTPVEKETAILLRVMHWLALILPAQILVTATKQLGFSDKGINQPSNNATKISPCENPNRCRVPQHLQNKQAAPKIEPSESKEQSTKSKHHVEPLSGTSKIQTFTSKCRTWSELLSLEYETFLWDLWTFMFSLYLEPLLYVEPLNHNVEPLLATFEPLCGPFTWSFAWNLGSFKCGTFMWTLCLESNVEPPLNLCVSTTLFWNLDVEPSSGTFKPLSLHARNHYVEPLCFSSCWENKPMWNLNTQLNFNTATMQTAPKREPSVSKVYNIKTIFLLRTSSIFNLKPYG